MSVYAERCRNDPAFWEREKAYGRNSYNKRKDDPEFLAKRRQYQKERLLDPVKHERRLQDQRRYRKKRNTDPVRHAEYLNDRRKYDNERYQEDAVFRENLNQQQNRDPRARYTYYKNGAKKEKRNYVFELTFEEANTLFHQDCTYCGEHWTAEQLMGIDRFDNSQGYVPSNVVAACGTCNCPIKHANAWPDIKRHLEAIVAYSIHGKPNTTPYNPRTTETLKDRLRRYPKQASERGYEMALTDLQMEDMFRSNCVYCNAMPNPFHGIDRVANDKDYTPENTVACCGICNRMKHTMTKEAFLAHVEKIMKHQ